MKSVLLAMLVVAAGLALPATAQNGGASPAAPTSAPGDDVVAAAKAAKAKRKASTSKVITNADVKKSKGKLIELQAVPESNAPAQTSLEKQAAERRERDALAVRAAAAQTKLAELERQLVQLEQQYFETNDPDLRDRVIRKQFDDVKAQRDAARQELDALTATATTPAAD